MSTKQIRWIVLSMALGLLGLVGFQLYWINNALHLQKEQFDFKVTDALQEVVRTLERQEIQYQGRQRLAAQTQHQQLMAIGKGNVPATTPTAPVRTQPSVRRAARPATKPRQRESRAPYLADEDMPGTVTIQMDALQPIRRPLTPEQLRTVDEFYRQQDELLASGNLEALIIQQERFNRWSDQVVESHLNEVLRSGAGLVVPDSVANAANHATSYRKPRTTMKAAKARSEKPYLTTSITMPTPATTTATNRQGSGTFDQSETIKAIFQGVLMADRPLAERVNRFTLDTLLHEALSERGITIPFDYAVRTPQQANLLFASAGLSFARMPASNQAVAQRQFEASAYKAALFPNNLLETGNYVYLFFPDQRSYIWSRMTVTLAGSAILILVIMGCFYVAISTILRQKKMADIKNDFINNMTHEFKTPISTIGLAVDMAREQLNAGTLQPTLVGSAGTSAGGAGLAERLSRYVGIIRDENQRLGSHVEKVLQMALLDKGEVKLALAPVNVHDVIGKVLNTMSLSIEQRQGEVDLDFEATDEVVLADEVHLTNMLYNLIDNAIKYSPDHVAISLRTQNMTLPNGKPAVCIAVADEGQGMTKEQQGRIFDTFYRVPTGNRHDVKGFGLGLSYVKKMADEHHGQITVTSTPGQGSEFQLVIPTEETRSEK